ncbi:MAG TPA: LLM class flavin-dependent oxidoreductase [Stellaceae bacterium]|nr:LLM class flavin-dependent oxidoreductase [Stellaceae bacterium]
MEFGIFSNSRRPQRGVGDAWTHDIDEIVTADRLGFREAWISEHQSPAELIICKAAGLTQQIRLGSAVRPLAYYHPLQVAIEANACDHLTGGRYQLGVGFGFYPANMEQRGLDFSKTREMMHASIDLILKLWTSQEPVDYDGPFWQGKGMVVKPGAVQAPHPPVAIACTKTTASAELAGRLGLMPLTGDFIPRERLRQFGDALVAGARAAGRTPGRRELRATRVIYVAETDAVAREDMRESYTETIRWEIANTPHHQVERIPPGGTLQDITYDYLIDTANIFVGSPDTVTRRILDFYAETGGFGVLMIHAGRDYATAEKRARSMRLFMDEVAPRLRHLDPDRQQAA